MKKHWVTIIFSQAKTILLLLQSDKTFRLSMREKSILAEVRDLIDALIQ